MSFKAAIVAARKSKYMTQEDLAKSIEVSLNAVRNWEKGKSFPQPRHRKSIAEALGIDMLSFVSPS